MENRCRRSWRSRLGWFVGLWAASVLTIAAIAFGLRAWLGA